MLQKHGVASLYEEYDDEEEEATEGGFWYLLDIGSSIAIWYAEYTFGAGAEGISI